MSKKYNILTREDRALLIRVKNLLEGVIETLDIAADKTLMKAIGDAEADVNSGRTRNYDEFTGDLKKSGTL